MTIRIPHLTLVFFLVPEFEKNLSRYTQNGNATTFGALTELLDRVAAGVL